MGNVIYEPQGRAREYAPLACNIYSGCDHGCVYCFGPGVLHKSTDDFHTPTTRGDDFLARLEKDARKLEGDRRLVLLCFTCDPYCWFNVRGGKQTTRRAIEILHSHGLRVSILTKGAYRSLWDLDLLGEGDEYGATLTFFSEHDSRKWEPKAADPLARVFCLKSAHEAGIRTWVSLEPVLDPEQTLQMVYLSYPFVDTFKVGKVNHEGSLPEPLRSQALAIDWCAFRRDTVALLERLGYSDHPDADRRYYLKADLRRYG